MKMITVEINVRHIFSKLWFWIELTFYAQAGI